MLSFVGQTQVVVCFDIALAMFTLLQGVLERLEPPQTSVLCQGVLESFPRPKVRETGAKAPSDNSERLSHGLEGCDMASVLVVSSRNIFLSVPLDGSLQIFLCPMSTGDPVV